MLPPDPTTSEWIIAGIAAGLIAVVGGAHLVRPSLRRASITFWGRAAALLLGTATAGVVLALVVVFAAGMRAERIDLAAGTGYPEGPLAGVLVTQNVGAADDVATYAAALLLPIAAVLGILAVGVAGSTPRGGLPYYDVAVQHGLWFVVLKLLRFPLLMSYPLIFRCLPHRRIVDFVADHVRLRTNTL